jgi:hypothetical protein
VSSAGFATRQATLTRTRHCDTARRDGCFRFADFLRLQLPGTARRGASRIRPQYPRQQRTTDRIRLKLFVHPPHSAWPSQPERGRTFGRASDRRARRHKVTVISRTGPALQRGGKDSRPHQRRRSPAHFVSTARSYAFSGESRTADHALRGRATLFSCNRLFHLRTSSGHTFASIFTAQVVLRDRKLDRTQQTTVSRPALDRHTAHCPVRAVSAQSPNDVPRPSYTGKLKAINNRLEMWDIRRAPQR